MLDHLFNVELQHRPDAGSVGDLDASWSEPVGNGDGAVRGPRLNGMLRWSLLERLGELVCEMRPGGEIRTNDGAVIRFEGLGFATRADTAIERWEVSASLRLRTEDERYAWLPERAAGWYGTFDGSTGRATYRAFTRPVERVA